MKIKSVKVHNFRSIDEKLFHLNDYSVIIGANNQGKSNFIRALRIFYEKDKYKYDQSVDFPKFKPQDSESWIEIEYSLTDDEYSNLKEEYRLENNRLRVRKYLASSDLNRVKKNQSNIFAYANGKLSETLFYGSKNISEAKLGTVIYIPDVMKTEDALKLTGPSPFREILSFVMSKVVKKSRAYNSLQESFKTFHSDFSVETSSDGYSLDSVKENINTYLEDWGVKFDFTIDPIESDEILKNLVNPVLSDKDLKKQVEIGDFGQGLQRHLIYTLLSVATDYVDKKESSKKEFSPDFSLILFEEPEAFLHPTQQDILNNKLRALANIPDQQIIITTHSSNFVSKNIDDLASLIRIKKVNGKTQVFQISSSEIQSLLLQNDQLVRYLKKIHDEPNTPVEDKGAIHELLNTDPSIVRLEQEAIKYLLWMDTERCNSFFADRVLICEGPTEKTFIDFMIKTEWFEEFSKKKAYIIECGGKFQFHRFMNLFEKMGIEHSLLYDLDQEGQTKKSRQHKYINQFILASRNEYTREIDTFPKDLESYFNISIAARPDKKPLNMMYHYKTGSIDAGKISDFKIKIFNLL